MPGGAGPAGVSIGRSSKENLRPTGTEVLRGTTLFGRPHPEGECGFRPARWAR